MDKKKDIIVGEFLKDIIAKMKLDKTVIPLVTIYEKPLDYPTEFVARLGFMRKGEFTQTNSVIVSGSLAHLKQQMPIDMTFIPRQEDDDPKIVGVYL